jgi:peptidyl-prolyl cis-trans isomerase B (cyclophilin B)
MSRSSVPAKKQNEREARLARERLRAYNARVTVHEKGKKRRTRDNVIAGAGLVVILVLAVIAQLMFFGGPGKPAPKSTATPTATPTTTPTPTATPTAGANQGDVPSASLAQNRTWTGTMTIDGVPLNFELDGKGAPQAVSSTISLIDKGFYTGTVCHRLTTGANFKVLQCGDPHGDDPSLAGQGGPGYSYGPVENAPADNDYPSGTIAMARQSDNAYSQGSQFFIVYGDTTIPSDTAGGYTVVGKVTSSLSALKKKVTDAGVSGGGTDGTPAVTPKIDSITVK